MDQVYTYIFELYARGKKIKNRHQEINERRNGTETLYCV